MKVITAPLDGNMDGEGFPTPSSLPEGAFDDDGMQAKYDEEFDLPIPVTGMEPITDEELSSYKQQQLREMAIGVPVGETCVGVEEVRKGLMPEFQARLINKLAPNHAFSEPAFGAPVIDPTVPAPPPIDVGVEPFEHIALNSPVAEGATPLVAPRPDNASDPLYAREAKIDQSLCRSCKHCFETVVPKAAKSHTFTPLQISVQCTKIDGRIFDVTDTPVYHCTFYKQCRDPGTVKPFKTLVAEIRKRFNLTAPPEVRS